MSITSVIKYMQMVSRIITRAASPSAYGTIKDNLMARSRPLVSFCSFAVSFTVLRRGARAPCLAFREMMNYKLSFDKWNGVRGPKNLAKIGIGSARKLN